jgi:ABC-type Fe3+ transport system substrate-binding protein
MTTAKPLRRHDDRPGVASVAKGFVVLLSVLAVPFVLRPRDNLLDASGESVVVITPFSEPLRYEFARGFREHMRKQGRAVWVDWRTPGSSREISRFIISEFDASFAHLWRHRMERPWSARIALAYADPGVGRGHPRPDDDEARLARRTFLESEVGIGIDLLFGAGSLESMMHARAGRLVDAGLVAALPEHFGAGGIPQTAGGKVLWDAEGRWVGTCLTTFGICYNRDSLARLGLANLPAQWSDLADPAYFGELAIADPSKSGAAAAAFEMVVHQQMNLRSDELKHAAAGESDAEATARAAAADDLESRARREGWDRAMRLIRRVSANARYFSSQGTQTALDIAMGDAAAGMCIDFYGRFQSETKGGGAGRLGFVTPRGGTAVDTDPIGLLRGAPHRELAIDFMKFVLSPEGQKLWNFRVGAPGGPQRYALRRMPILPALYAPAFDTFRSDPGENPYDEARAFTYHAAWTGPLFRAIVFIVKATCVDAHDELATAYQALFRAGFPPRATALFEDVNLIDYDAASGPLRAASSGSSVDEAIAANRLIAGVRAQYARVAELARAGE